MRSSANELSELNKEKMMKKLVMFIALAGLATTTAMADGLQNGDFSSTSNIVTTDNFGYDWVDNGWYSRDYGGGTETWNLDTGVALRTDVSSSQRALVQLWTPGAQEIGVRKFLFDYNVSDLAGAAFEFQLIGYNNSGPFNAYMGDAAVRTWDSSYVPVDYAEWDVTPLLFKTFTIADASSGTYTSEEIDLTGFDAVAVVFGSTKTGDVSIDNVRFVGVLSGSIFIIK